MVGPVKVSGGTGGEQNGRAQPGKGPGKNTNSLVVVGRRHIAHHTSRTRTPNIERLLVEIIQAGIGREVLEELLPNRLHGLDVELEQLVLGQRLVPAASRDPGAGRFAASNNWAVAGSARIGAWPE